MWTWISENSGALNVLVSAAMLVVWGVYLQLILQSYRRERRPKILISRGAGTGLRSRCLLSNMSAEAIYIHSLAAKLGLAEEKKFAAVTDLGDLDDPGLDGRPKTYQGPVAAGDFIDIGTFEAILGRAGWQSLPDPAAVQDGGLIELELTVIATYRSEDLIVGATRCFELEANGAGADDTGWTIKARTADTRQIRSKTERKALQKAYTNYLN
jgi:hypothetical protein